MCTNHSEPHSWIGLAWVCKWMLSIQWLKSNTKVYSFSIISDAILTKINQGISTPNNKYFIQAKPSRQSSILFCVKQRLIQEYSPLLPDIWILSDYFSSSENHKMIHFMSVARGIKLLQANILIAYMELERFYLQAFFSV